MAIFGYGRVSTVEQTAENQRHEIEQAGYKIEYWYADTVSCKAHAAQRKHFGILLGKLRAKDTLVVSRLDRLCYGAMRPTYWQPLKPLALFGSKWWCFNSTSWI